MAGLTRDNYQEIRGGKNLKNTTLAYFKNSEEIMKLVQLDRKTRYKKLIIEQLNVVSDFKNIIESHAKTYMSDWRNLEYIIASCFYFGYNEPEFLDLLYEKEFLDLLESATGQGRSTIYNFYTEVRDRLKKNYYYE